MFLAEKKNPLCIYLLFILMVQLMSLVLRLLIQKCNMAALKIMAILALVWTVEVKSVALSLFIYVR